MIKAFSGRHIRFGVIALFAGGSFIAGVTPASAAATAKPPCPNPQGQPGVRLDGSGIRQSAQNLIGPRGPQDPQNGQATGSGRGDGRTADLINPGAFYSIDGSGNNLGHPGWGAAGTALLRIAPAQYSDGSSAPAGATRPSARVVSNALSAQSEDKINDRNLSDFVYVWGQFLDHDIDLSTTGSESFPIPVPRGDPSFDPASTGTKVMNFNRSGIAAGTGSASSNPRQQVNSVTAYIDGSQVYGSDGSRAEALRTMSGGLLKTSAGNLMPFNTSGLSNANDSHMLPDAKLFLAGDVRANENPDLASLQTVFMREHNRIALQQQAAHPDWTDEQLYQAARQIVIAELQSITVNEFLPALLGDGALRGYRGYQDSVNASIANEFSTTGYRFGHSLLDGELARLNNDGSEAAAPLSLAQAFFNTSVFDPTRPAHSGDIDPFLKAASSGNAQEVDVLLVDEVRNFLFGAPGQGGLDLASLNIQRGRDHGLADYNRTRAAYGLSRVTSFAQITSDTALQEKLKSLYGSVDDIDLWVGVLVEDHVRGSSVGPLAQQMLVEQFGRLRDGDRLWFENIFGGDQLARLKATTLSSVIQRNTALTTLQPNVFFHMG